MKPLSTKAKSQVIYCLGQIASKSFDQETLQSLLIAIRESSPDKSFTHEIANFVAHSDRNRGLIFSNLSAYNVKSIFDGKTQRIRIMFPGFKPAQCLIDDLCEALAANCFDAKCIQDNHDELIVCFFGLLHLARVELVKGKFHTLKISRNMYGKVDGTKFLSIAAVIPKERLSPVFNSELEAKMFLGELNLNDFDIQTVFRTVREKSGGLRLVKV